MTFSAQVQETRELLTAHLKQIESYANNGNVQHQNLQFEISKSDIKREVPFFKFMDYIFLAQAEPILPETDENGEIIKRNYMKKAEKVMRYLSRADLEDHILHAKMYYCEIKASDLLKKYDDEGYRSIKKLFKTAKDCCISCINDFNCYSAKLYIQTNYFAGNCFHFQTWKIIVEILVIGSYIIDS